MKREIFCKPCALEAKYVDRKDYGKLKVNCVCDSCLTVLSPGQDAGGLSYYSDNPKVAERERLIAWWKEYLEV